PRIRDARVSVSSLDTAYLSHSCVGTIGNLNDRIIRLDVDPNRRGERQNGKNSPSGRGWHYTLPSRTCDVETSARRTTSASSENEMHPIAAPYIPDFTGWSSSELCPAEVS